MFSLLCRYIGSLEDLKSKFGTSYHLEVKMTDTEQSDALHAKILHLFPSAARQERSLPRGLHTQPRLVLGRSVAPTDLAE